MMSFIFWGKHRLSKQIKVFINSWRDVCIDGLVPVCCIRQIWKSPLRNLIEMMPFIFCGHSISLIHKMNSVSLKRFKIVKPKSELLIGQIDINYENCHRQSNCIGNNFFTETKTTLNPLLRLSK